MSRELAKREPSTRLTVLAAPLALCLTACDRDRYEVVGRVQKEVPNYLKDGTHNEVDYVLLHDGHRIYATCDAYNLSNLDPHATCGFRPLRSYACVLGPDGDLEHQTLPQGDLNCKDADGHNVYLYVSMPLAAGVPRAVAKSGS
jgi:hypothetical protein